MTDSEPRNEIGDELGGTVEVLPSGWVSATLGEVAQIQSGAGFPVALQGEDSGDYPLAKVSDISAAVLGANGVLARAANYLSADKAKEIGAKVFPVGSVLFAKIGEAIRLNRRAIAAVPALADNNVMALVPDIDCVIERYLYYFMHTIDLYEYAQATTVPSVRKSDVAQIPIPIPPLREQELIVAKLEELLTQLDAGVVTLKRIQASLQRYKAAVLKAACEGKLVLQDRNDEPASQLLERILAER